MARNRWTITAVDQQRTQAAFEAVFAPRGILGRLLAGWLLVQIGRTGRYLLGDLKHYAEHGVPSPRKQASSTAPDGTGRACDRAGAKEPPERADDVKTARVPASMRPARWMRLLLSSLQLRCHNLTILLPLYARPKSSEDSSEPGCPSLSVEGGQDDGVAAIRGQRRSQRVVPDICQKLRHAQPHAASRCKPLRCLSPGRLCGHGWPCRVA